MLPAFLHKTRNASFLLAFFLVITLFSDCQQDQKTTAAPQTTEPATAPAPTREQAAPPPAEDYSGVVLQVARKEYEPLGRKIVANREQVSALKLSAQANSEIGTKNGARDYEKNQSKVEADFVENMKMLDFVEEKQNSKEMSKEESAAEKSRLLKNIKEIEKATTELEKALGNAKH